MKLTTIIFLVTLMQVSATVYSQTKLLNLDMKDSSIESVLKEIEQQSEFFFLYNNKQIDVGKRVNIQFNEKSIIDVLDRLFNGTNINYLIKDRQIVLYKGNLDSFVNTVDSEGCQKKNEITGVVTDELGQPLPGVTVVVKGTTKGTVTNVDGRFNLTIPDNAKILQFSFIGMKTMEVPVANTTNFSVAMEKESYGVDEVVVVGYGTQKKVNVIGSISQISNKKMENRSAPALSNILTGQMPGVTVTQRSGKPGYSGGTIRIRGIGSFGASPDALVLIDGIPGSINDIRPEIVDNISVLKDASTAAIYGSRAANGVILITTKTGEKGTGKINVSYNGYVGLNNATALPDFVNSWEWAKLYNRAKGGTPTYTEEDIRQMRDKSNPDMFANENYLSEILGNNGFQTGHDISVHGGDNGNQYFISYGIISQDGIVEKNNYTRHNARVNLINRLASNLKLTTRLSGIFAEVDEPNVPGGDDASGMVGIIQKAVRFPGLYPTQISTGEWGMGPENHGTPVSWIKSSSFFRNQKQTLKASANLEYSPFQNFVINGIGAYNFAYKEDRGFKTTHKIEGDRTLGPSWFRNTINKNAYKSIQFTADYNKSIGNHNFGILAGYSWEEQQSKNLQGTRDNFPSNDLPQMNAGAASNMQNSGTTNEWALQSIFGRMKYNFDERYLMEMTMRYDGSSKFPKDDKYAFFPSVGLGWRISEESFIKENSDLSWINNLKLKASAGKLGNQNIGNYPYQSVYKFGADYPFGNYFQQGAAVGTLVDPTLKWEETSTYDIGIETILKNGFLSADINYFHRKTTDILYAPGGSVSNVLGMKPSVMNTGSLKNSGWEFEVRHKNNVGKINYNLSANLSIIKNKVLSLGVGNIEQLNGLVGNGSSLFIGYPMHLYYGYVADGVFLDQNDIDSWYNQKAITPNAQPGDIRYKDISGPDGKPDGVVNSEYDRVYLGSRIPKYTYGITFGADYNGFDLSILMQGVEKVKGKLDNYAGYAFRSDKGNVQRWQMEGAFDPENPVRYPKYPRMEILSNVTTSNVVNSSFWIRNASYFRIRNIQVGYTISNKLMSALKMESLRVYMQAENPITWHHFPKGWDPEINTGGNYYPILRTYTLGLNFKF